MWVIGFNPWHIIAGVLLFGFIGLGIGHMFRLVLDDDEEFNSCLSGIVWIIITSLLTRLVFLGIFG